MRMQPHYYGNGQMLDALGAALWESEEVSYEDLVEALHDMGADAIGIGENAAKAAQLAAFLISTQLGDPEATVNATEAECLQKTGGIHYELGPSHRCQICGVDVRAERRAVSFEDLGEYYS